jgi:hypothetical protein
MIQDAVQQKPQVESSPSIAPAGTATDTTATAPPAPAREIGGRGGAEPTRYGDWEKNGRCIDF